MFGQSVQLADFGVVGFLVMLEALLSADNALVLALMVKHLSETDRQRALTYGLGGSVIFRFVAILLAAFVIRFWWLQAIGAVYLIGLPIKHFLDQAPSGDPKTHLNFWKTVVAVEVADLAFALDSILAGVSTVGGRQDKIWVVYTGAIIGVILLRFVANKITNLMKRYPVFDDVAYVIVGWVGVKLAFEALHKFDENYDSVRFSFGELNQIVFWFGLILIFAVGSFVATRPNRGNPSEP